MKYDNFIKLGKVLNDNIVDPKIRDGNFHYIVIPNNENSPIRIGDRLYHVTHHAELVDDYGDTTVGLEDYMNNLIKNNNLKAYGVIKYTKDGVYIFGASDYWFFEIKNSNFSHITINLTTLPEGSTNGSNISLYSPTYYGELSKLENGNIGKALLSRYGSSDVVIAPGETVKLDLETKGYSIGYSNSTNYSDYKTPLLYKVRFNLPSTIPESGKPNIILTFKNYDDDRDKINCNLVVSSSHAFDGLYNDMIDIDFNINSTNGTTINIAPYRVTVTH